MDRLIGFLKAQEDNKYELGSTVFEYKLDMVWVTFDNGVIISVPNDYDLWELQDMYQKQTKSEFRICDKCGKPYDQGFMRECGYIDHLCEGCFEEYAKIEGLTGVVDDGEGGYYLDKDGDGTGWFYTEWF